MADAPDAPYDTPYQSLYRRFRPATFEAVKGQDHVVLALRNAVRDHRVAHAYLFSGPRGTGKTSTARILAKALNCTDLHDGEPCGICVSCVEITKGTSLDVHELDAASNNGVEAMRDLVSRAALGTPGRQKVYIVDEVHMLSTAASNALLKTLEEPPAHVIFVLATTDPQKVLPTIRSRTQHFEFRLLGPETLGELLDQVRREAQLDVPDEALDLAVRRGRGSARDALSVLDQVAASDSVDDDLPELDEVAEALAERDVGRALVAVAHLTSAGFSPQQLTGDLVDYFRQGFLAMVAPDLMTVSGAEREALAAQAERVGLATLVRAMEVLGLAQVAMRDAPEPRVNLEVALVRLAHPEADDSPEALLSRIERLEALARTTGLPAAAAGGEVPMAPSATVPPTARGAEEAAPGRRRSPAPGGPPTGREVSSDPVAAAPPGPDSGDAGAMAGRRTLGAVRREAAAGRGPTTGPEAPGAPGTPTNAPPGPTTAPPPAAVAPPEAEARAVAPSDPAPPAAAGPFPTRDQLVQAWGDHVIGRLRPKAKALFQAGRFVGVEGDRAVFGLPNETHRSRCEEVRGEIEVALSEQFGLPVGLDLVVDPGAEPPRSREGAPTADRATALTGGGRGSDPTAADPTAGSTGPDTVAIPADPAADPAGPPDPRDTGTPEDAEAVEGVHPPDDQEDPLVFDESELGEVAEVDNSAETRVLQAFPGAEEVG